MLLDIKNNELLFRKVLDTEAFRDDLKELKDVKVREYKGVFYISLAHVNPVYKMLKEKYPKELSLSIPFEKFENRFIQSKGEVQIDWEPALCTIKGPNIPWNEVIPITSYFDKGAKNSKSYGKSWSGFNHLFNPIRGTFPSGLLERIIFILSKNQIPFNINQTFTYPKPSLNIQPIFPFIPTQDQIDSVEALFIANNGIAKLPTGFGKTSYVAASLIARKGVPSLFLANKRVLTDDAKNDFDDVFKNSDIKVGMIGDGVFDPGDITIASIQTIAAALKPPTIKERQLVQYQIDLAEQRLQLIKDVEHIKETKKELKKYKNRIKSIDARIQRHKMIIPFLKKILLFIVDEAQVLGTDQWNSFLHACPAPYRYTLSATPTRSDGGGIQIIAATGELRYESSAGEQIEKGRLSEFVGHFRKFDHKVDKELIKQLDIPFHQVYDLFIVHNELRNDHLCNKVLSWAHDYSVLALVTRKAHGEIINNMLIKKGMKEEDIRYIDGTTSKKERISTIEAFRNSEFPVLIGTSVFDVGFNAKNASKMVRFNGGKSEVLEPQRAGRTVRKRLDDTIGETYDLIDINVPFLESQSWIRLRLLKEEFGENRIKFNREIIDGELNVVGLKELVNEMPVETDRQKGEEIIQRLQYGDDFLINTDDTYNQDDYQLDELDVDLQAALKELTME